MLQQLKHLIKKKLWGIVFRNKIAGNAISSNKKFVEALDYSSNFTQQQLNIFTIANEDGLLLDIFTKIGPTNKFFIDIGSNDCINSNCANLAFHHHWNGLFIDGNSQILNRGKYIYKQYFKRAVPKFQFTQALLPHKILIAF